MLDIHTYPDAATAAREAASAITDALTNWSGEAILLLFSGGSPLEILKYLPKSEFDERVTVGVSDERYSTDPAINNFAQVRTLLSFKRAIDTRPQPNETLEQLGIRFDAALKKWKTDHPTGKILITQGIGLDGHSAGMMPFPENPARFNELFNNPNIWAVGYDAGSKNKYPLRVTTTIPFLKMVDLSIVFVCGIAKKKPLADVFRVTPLRPPLLKLHEVPGRIIHEMPHCLLYTDQSVDTLKQ
jgi:6-phosphogluconolactonase/glucosamine-6-phosphate isomerase/deaminase